ncbi:uncharacterized protein NFIA_038150 [Aspergillus fischeri NRRL 181]|uniref:Uncharacterized protein n=1 Tax=Neosartorya fischeri (strain ATCC 1020 / DSM 3700 / CBS 544.65 / FGSC A1164 / JCM 1740 / NRRL 181 / WB 181) TaxID=331117 RepID=A1CZS1_NEOFI|nr:conserved hypothetical protein [Aspergillus fischeri NRRL 181]EAW24241.1 conserved hypothetical protein [Aspergillus fischeri NRRL 181]
MARRVNFGKMNIDRCSPRETIHDSRIDTIRVPRLILIQGPSTPFFRLFPFYLGDNLLYLAVLQPNMRWSLAGLLPSLCLVVLTNASPLGHESAYDIEGVDSLNTLVRRVRTGPGGGTVTTPKKTTDLFLLDSGPGGCTSKEATLDNWLTEVFLLHDAIKTAYANIQGDRSWMLMWYTWFGVQLNMQTGGVDVSDAANKQLWDTIGDHISRVTKFLAGAGLANPQVAGENPRLFCGPEAGEHQPWSESVVKDHNGQDVVTARDPDTQQPTEYLKLGTAFLSTVRDPNANAFWFSAFNGYDLDFSGETSLCAENPKDGKRRFAKTARPASSWPVIFSDGADFTFGRANRHILFCPRSFSPPTGFHSYPSLTKAVEEDNYPTAGMKDENESLDKMMPVSSTLYHELYHLTDDDNTKDQAYSLDRVIRNARDPSTREGNSHNPETYTLFATAAYLYLNAPQDEEPCLYISGFPKKASNPFA